MRGFQQKNIMAGHYQAMFFTGFFIAACEVGGTYIVVKGGLWMCISAGIGSAFGIVSAVFVHDRIMKKKPDTSVSRARSIPISPRKFRRL